MITVASSNSGLAFRRKIDIGTAFVHSRHKILKTNSLATVELISKDGLLGHMTTPTVTENGALYFAQHRASKARAALFRRSRKTKKTNRIQIAQLTFEGFTLPGMRYYPRG
jgi:hypothetical protein